MLFTWIAISWTKPWPKKRQPMLVNSETLLSSTETWLLSEDLMALLLLLEYLHIPRCCMSTSTRLISRKQLECADSLKSILSGHVLLQWVSTAESSTLLRSLLLPLMKQTRSNSSTTSRSFHLSQAETLLLPSTAKSTRRLSQSFCPRDCSTELSSLTSSCTSGIELWRSLSRTELMWTR